MIKTGSAGDRCYECWDVPMRPHEVETREQWEYRATLFLVHGKVLDGEPPQL